LWHEGRGNSHWGCRSSAAYRRYFWGHRKENPAASRYGGRGSSMNRSRSETGDRTQRRSGETMILFSVGGPKFAIAAGEVNEIRDLSGLQKFSLDGANPRFGKVKQVFERQGRRYFVVDSCEHFHLAMARPSRLLVLQHASTAIVVDAIDCMVELNSIQALPRPFS